METYRVENNRMVAKWWYNGKNFREVAPLVGHNDDFFQKNADHCRNVTACGVRYNVYKMTTEGVVIYAYTSKRGTAYEVGFDGSLEKFQRARKVGVICLRFMQELAKKLAV